MKNLTKFDCTAAYDFGKKTENADSNIIEENNDSIHLTEDESAILTQVIDYAKNALFSRFSDYVYQEGNKDRPHYKFVCKGAASSKYQEMIKKHHLTQADLPEFMEDMIREETFVRAEPLRIKKKENNWKTVFIFRDRICFEEDGEIETIELKFTLDTIVKDLYDMEILAFGYPVPVSNRPKPKKAVRNVSGKRVSVWHAA